MVLTLTCMSSVVAIVGGPITNHYGWRYMFIIYLPFVCVGFLTVFFFVPETQFRRPFQAVASDAIRDLPTAAEIRGDKAAAGSTKEEHESGGELDASTTNSSQHVPKTFTQRLAVYTGTYTDEDLFRLFLAPFITLLNPAVVWVCSQYT